LKKSLDHIDFVCCLLLYLLPNLISYPVQGQEQHGIELSQAPKNNQLFPRAPNHGFGTISIEGTILSSTLFDSLLVKHTDSHGQEETHRLALAPQKSFYKSYLIEAALVDHRFDIIKYHQGSAQVIYRAIDVVVGDAFMIYGQSNAAGGRSDTLKNHFMRTFGTSTQNGTSALRWHALKDDRTNIIHAENGIGIWAQQLAHELIEKKGIPVAFINGAVGGTSIGELLPEDHQDAIPTRHYAQLRERINEAKLQGKLRAIIWWQGEADGFPWYCRTVNEYQTLFQQMTAFWWRDFGPYGDLFLFQPQSCDGFDITPDCMVQVQEAQRQFAITNEHATLLPTGHLEKTSDLCHFTESGYLNAGKDLANILRSRLYGDPLDESFASLASLSYSDCQRNGLVMSLQNASTILLDETQLDNLRFEGDSTIQVQEIIVAGDQITLQLSGTLNDRFTGLTYRSSSVGLPLFLVNEKSIAQFFNMKPKFPDSDQDGYSCVVDCNDQEARIYPDALDFSVNGIDEDCDGFDGPFDSMVHELDLKTKVFPLPTYRTIDLYFGLEGTYQITLVNNNGDAIKRVDAVTQNMLEIDLLGLTPGNYFLRVHHMESNTSITKKILKY